MANFTDSTKVSNRTKISLDDHQPALAAGPGNFWAAIIH